jgi:hypothetical protein
MAGAIKSAVSKRLEGGKPSVLQATLAALAAGIAAAVITYKLMRS